MYVHVSIKVVQHACLKQLTAPARSCPHLQITQPPKVQVTSTCHSWLNFGMHVFHGVR